MKNFSITLAAVVLWPLSSNATLIVDLGTADAFAVLSGSTVTNTGSTVVHGSLGLSPGTSVIGFPPGVVTGGTIHVADATALQAQSDLKTAYLVAAGVPCGDHLTGDLGGLTLTPGVYCFDSSAQLTGTLTLNALGDPNSAFIFQIGSTLTTAPGSSVAFTNGGEGDSVFWQVGSSATLDTTTAFAGNILALTSITLDTGATIECGRALARNGAVTMDTNVVSIDTAGCETTTSSGGSSVPEPSSASFLLVIGAPGLLWLRRLRSAR
jgi:hypothetical protein